MTLKEISDLKANVRYVSSCDLSYNPIDQSKMGKVLTLFLDKRQYIKSTQSVRKLISETRKAMERVTYFLQTYFFDENNLNDSDISSYHSSCSPERTSRTPSNYGKGLMMLRRASQRIESGVHPLELRASNSFPGHNLLQADSGKKFSVPENSRISSLKTQRKTSIAQSPPLSSLISEQFEGINPSIMNILRSKTRSSSNDFPGPSLGLSSGAAEPSMSFEGLLSDYVLSLPTSIDEFYKVMGELYVREILNQRPDLQSPSQLMKELLLGDPTATQERISHDLVRDLMEAATSRKEVREDLCSAGENQLAENLMQHHLSKALIEPSSLAEQSIHEGQNMVDSNVLSGQQNFSLKERETIRTEIPLQKKKREAKSDYKENKRSLKKISQNPRDKTSTGQPACGEGLQPPTHKEEAKRPKTARKRAPKKKNPRVFLSKISSNSQENGASHKRR